MDAAKLQDAIDYGTTQASFAIRVYRDGCLVGEDRLAPTEPPLAVPELVDGQVGDLDDLRPRDDARA